MLKIVFRGTLASARRISRMPLVVSSSLPSSAHACGMSRTVDFETLTVSAICRVVQPAIYIVRTVEW
jgi:hypothetical protein